jgi:hypothetical protein
LPGFVPAKPNEDDWAKTHDEGREEAKQHNKIREMKEQEERAMKEAYWPAAYQAKDKPLVENLTGNEIIKIQKWDMHNAIDKVNETFSKECEDVVWTMKEEFNGTKEEREKKEMEIRMHYEKIRHDAVMLQIEYVSENWNAQGLGKAAFWQTLRQEMLDDQHQKQHVWPKNSMFGVPHSKNNKGRDVTKEQYMLDLLKAKKSIDKQIKRVQDHSYDPEKDESDDEDALEDLMDDLLHIRIHHHPHHTHHNTPFTSLDGSCFLNT